MIKSIPGRKRFLIGYNDRVKFGTGGFDRKEQIKTKKMQKETLEFKEKVEKNGLKLNGKQAEQNILNNMITEIKRFN